jgi:hypothetical protein
MAEPAEEIQAEDTCAGTADVYDKAAGRAFLAGDYDKALTFIAVARNMDPARADLWAQREFRVKSTETQQYPLAELLSRRLGRLTRGLDDPSIAQWVQHNQAIRAGVTDLEAEL